MGSTLFRNPSELQFNRNVRMLIYGQPGIGKSTLALSAPRPVLLDFDGGIHRVNGAHLCPTLQVESYDQVLEALNEDLSCFDTIIIDSRQDARLHVRVHHPQESKASKYDGSLSLQGYGTRKQMFVDFLNRVSMMNKHVVFVAHEMEEKNNDTKYVPGDEVVSRRPHQGLIWSLCQGSRQDYLPNPQEEFYAKNSCNLPDAHKIPSSLTRRKRNRKERVSD